MLSSGTGVASIYGHEAHSAVATTQAAITRSEAAFALPHFKTRRAKNHEEHMKSTTTKEEEEEPQNKKSASKSKASANENKVHMTDDAKLVERDILQKAEAGLMRMEKVFESRCMDIAHKIEKERQKAMDLDLGKYREQMEEMVEHFKEEIHANEHHESKKASEMEEGLLSKLWGKFKHQQATAEAKDESSSSSGESDQEEATTKKPVVEEPPTTKRALRPRKAKVAATSADMIMRPAMRVDEEELEGWGSDVSENELRQLACNGLHEAVHKNIICMQDLRTPKHEELDEIWVSMSNLCLDGPTQTDIKDPRDRQAVLVQKMTVLHDKVSAEAIRLHVSPDTLYCVFAPVGGCKVGADAMY